MRKLFATLILGAIAYEIFKPSPSASSEEKAKGAKLLPPEIDGGASESFMDEGYALPSWGFLPGFSDMGDVFSAAPTTVALPPGTTVTKYAIGALAPMVSGERVYFGLDHEGGGSGGSLFEGVYNGPSVPSAADATVTVDRLAKVGVEPLVKGVYTIPASAVDGSHTRLQRVSWIAVPPASVGLSALDPKSVEGLLEIGTKITVAARSSAYDTAAFIATITALDGASITAVLLKVYRELHNEGEGPLVSPKSLEQATVHLTTSDLVDPSSFVAV